MDQAYLEKVEIVDVEILDIQEITANVTIKVKGHELKCFVSNFNRQSPFFAGEKCDVVLSLMTTEHEKINSKEKNIVSTKQFEDHCILSGEIKNFIPRAITYYDEKTGSYYSEDTDYKYGIVDCGIFIAVEVPKDSLMKTGDYIKAEGRLDIKKVKD
ncbi:MAG: hypothetical protein FIB08_00770 [Candidatus Methanoperedens sp.]|nr:hypothetical protein [Candidatus Methanoperedens sp.]